MLAAPNAAGNSEQLVPKAHSHPNATVTRRATQSAAVATEPNPHARTGACLILPARPRTTSIVVSRFPVHIFVLKITPRPHLVFMLLTWSAFVSAGGYAVAKPGKDEARTMKRDATGDDTGGKPKNRDDSSDARGTKASPADVQARSLDRLREKLEVPDETEWALIIERITKIDEIRRTLWTSSSSVRGALPGAEKAKRSSGSSGNPERDALRSAVSDNLPDAEIKSRLAHAHEIHRKNEVRLAQAQADLRAVLSIRQEAVAVMAGLLPP